MSLLPPCPGSPSLLSVGRHRFWLAAALVGMVLSAHAESTSERPPSFCVNYAAQPSLLELSAFEWSIVEPTAAIDLKALHKAGRTCLAYVSTVEARPDSAAAREAQQRGVAVIGRNDEWQSHLLDILDPKWLPMMLDVVVPSAMTKGFDGVFLDTLDSAQRVPGDVKAKRAALIALVKGIHERYPAKKIILNRGFDLVSDVASMIQGVLVESLFRSFDPKTREFTVVKSSDTEWLTQRLREVQSHSLPVLVVDYVSPGEPEVAMATAKKIEALKCSAFITTPELEGVNVGPMRQIARRILVVHGTDTAAARVQAAPPIDTMAATHFQAVLEWMGYEFDFHDIGFKALPAELPFTYAGVIVDELDCQKPITKQAVLAWLQKVKARKVPILFAGDVPFADDDIRSEFAQIFGLGGNLTTVHGVIQPAVDHRDPVVMTGEIEITAQRLGFMDLSAPVEAEVYLSLKGTDREGRTVRFDPCFMAPWGGVWLEPYVVFRASQANHAFYADVFAFLERWLRASLLFPVPDTTTRDGRRLFYSHIDGDGFASLSQFPNHPPCAEVTRDRILKKYPLPVTVSVVEADVRGWLKTLKKEDSPKYVELARSMFALPQVQAGSHSFSHPFIWDSTDPNPGHYGSSKTTLANDIEYPVVDPKREIAGSIDYINQNLLPSGRRVELMLWSGNCRPGIDALRLCRELGVENMNGGDTIMNKLSPSVAGVGPRIAKWGDEIQIFAANQNEFMYANGFEGPTYGGFARVIDTFTMTERPRRLKPVNVYYHFYSATYLSSLRALEQIHDWCMGQRLHPVTALQYAQIVRDAHRTQIYAVAPQHWRITNTGDLRTYRLPAKAGTPDLSLCQGISGWNREGEVMYVHTTGRPVVDLVLAPADKVVPAWPHLVNASADVTVGQQTRDTFEFRVGGWDRVMVELGGLPAEVQCPILIGDRKAFLTADKAGLARMTVAPATHVKVQIPAPYAVSP